MLIVNFRLSIVAIKQSESQIMSFTKIDYTMKQRDGNDETETTRRKQQDGNDETETMRQYRTTQTSVPE